MSFDKYYGNICLSSGKVNTQMHLILQKGHDSQGSAFLSIGKKWEHMGRNEGWGLALLESLSLAIQSKCLITEGADQFITGSWTAP